MNTKLYVKLRLPCCLLLVTVIGLPHAVLAEQQKTICNGAVLAEHEPFLRNQLKNQGIEPQSEEELCEALGIVTTKEEPTTTPTLNDDIDGVKIPENLN